MSDFSPKGSANADSDAKCSEFGLFRATQDSDVESQPNDPTTSQGDAIDMETQGTPACTDDLSGMLTPCSSGGNC